MSSSARGASTSAAEVTNISAHGFWLLAADEELFVPYEQFPWFKNARIADILGVEEPTAGHFYWPALDVDLSIEILRHPERFPLVAGGT